MNKNKYDTKDLIFGAIITAVFTVLGSLAFYYFTNKEPIIFYEILPVSYFKKDSFQISIINVRIINDGRKECEEIIFTTDFGENNYPEEYTFNKGSSNIKIKENIDTSNRRPFYTIPYLNPKEEIIFSFFINKIVDQQNIEVNLRGKGINGSKYVSSSDPSTTLMLLSTIVMTSITLGIVSFVLFHQRKAITEGRILAHKKIQKLKHLLEINNIQYENHD